MKWFSNLKMAAKLALGFGLCLLLALIQGVTAIRGQAAMHNSAVDLYKHQLLVTESADNVVQDILHYQNEEADLFIPQSAQELARNFQELGQADKTLQSDMEELKPLLETEQGKAMLKAVTDKWAQSKPVSDNIVALVRQNKMQE